VASVDAGCERRPGGLVRLRYSVAGPGAGGCLQFAVAGGRQDGLWAHTCCEFFVATHGNSAYREFNFSTAGAWAAYDFSACRQDMHAAIVAQPPKIELRDVTADRWLLEVTLAAADLVMPAATGRQCAALAAVIEAPAGQLSYWALRHPAPGPDFHHRDAFVYELI
jgi:hypothetical protein